MGDLVNGRPYNWISSFDDVIGENGLGAGGCGADSFLKGML